LERFNKFYIRLVTADLMAIQINTTC